MPRVLYLAPYINEYLFDLQARVYEAFKDLPGDSAPVKVFI